MRRPHILQVTVRGALFLEPGRGLLGAHPVVALVDIGEGVPERGRHRACPTADVGDRPRTDEFQNALAVRPNGILDPGLSWTLDTGVGGDDADDPIGLEPPNVVFVDEVRTRKPAAVDQQGGTELCRGALGGALLEKPPER